MCWMILLRRTSYHGRFVGDYGTVRVPVTVDRSIDRWISEWGWSVGRTTACGVYFFPKLQKKVTQ